MHRRMQSLLAVAACGALLAAPARAQEAEGWTPKLVFGLNATQASFDNWTGGGEDAMAWQAALDGGATRGWTRSSLEFTGKVAYGETKLGDSGFRKSTDELQLGAVYTWARDLWLNPYASLALATQLADGFVYDDATGTKVQVSAIFDPAYLTESLGVGHDFSGVKVKLGAAAKQTLSSEDYGWADDPDTASEIETLRSEFGAELVAEYEHAFNEQVTFKSKFTAFWAAGPFDETDTDWDSSLVASLTDALKVSVNLRILRDADISRARQLKQNLALGVIYTLL